MNASHMRATCASLSAIAPDRKWDNRSMAIAAPTMPGVGDLAPDFTLPGTPDGDPVALSSFKGSKHVLLAFYVFDFSPG
jgi:hypothetical protein